MTIVKDGVGTTLTGTGGWSIYKIRITPPAISVGDKIDLTHLENSEWRTGAPPTLRDLSGCSFVGLLDEEEYFGMTERVGKNQQLTLTLPGTQKFIFWGYIANFAVGEIGEGGPVECTGTIEATNMNGTDEETGPAE